MKNSLGAALGPESTTRPQAPGGATRVNDSSAVPPMAEWCGQCGTYTNHRTNRCPVGEDVRCLTHNAWMKRGAKRCERFRWGRNYEPANRNEPCEAAS